MFQSHFIPHQTLIVLVHILKHGTHSNEPDAALEPNLPAKSLSYYTQHEAHSFPMEGGQ